MRLAAFFCRAVFFAAALWALAAVLAADVERFFLLPVAVDSALALSLISFETMSTMDLSVVFNPASSDQHQGQPSSRLTIAGFAGGVCVWTVSLRISENERRAWQDSNLRQTD